jgi:hypothetical protein
MIVKLSRKTAMSKRSSASFVTTPFSSPRLPTMQQRTLETLMARRKRVHEAFLAADKADAVSCLGAGRAASKELLTLSSAEGFALLDETLFHTLQQLIAIQQMFRAAEILKRIVRESRFPMPVALLGNDLVAYANFILQRLPTVGCCDPGIVCETNGSGAHFSASDAVAGVDDGGDDDSASSLLSSSFSALTGTSKTMALRLFAPLCNVLVAIFPRRLQPRDDGETDGGMIGEVGEESQHQKLLLFSDSTEQLDAIHRIVREDYCIPVAGSASGDSLIALQTFATLLSTAMAVAVETGEAAVMQGLVVMFLNAFVACDGSGTLLSQVWADYRQLEETKKAAEYLSKFADDFLSSFYYGVYASLRRGCGPPDAPAPPASPRSRYESFCVASGVQSLLDSQIRLVVDRNQLAVAARTLQFCAAERAPKWLATLSEGSSFSAEEVELLDVRCQTHVGGSIAPRLAPVLRRSLEQSSSEQIQADENLSHVLNHCLDLCSFTFSDGQCEEKSPDAAVLVSSQLREVLECLPPALRCSLSAEQCTTICTALRPVVVAGGWGDAKDTVVSILRDFLLPSLSRQATTVGSVFGSCIELMLRCGMLPEAKALFATLVENKNVFSSTVPAKPFKMLFDAARDSGDVEFCLVLRERRQDLF